jgi:hypothetical protein
MKRLSICAVSGFVALGFAMAGAKGQELEPRSYTNTPVGMNFVVAGYAYSDGKIAFDPSLPIVDAQFRANTGFLAHVRAIDFLGNSAKIGVAVPYTSFSGHALANGVTREREMSGFGDPQFRLSVNFFGAPALTVKEFASYRQDLIIGASILVSPPLGQYDHSKLVNLGNNRWSLRTELGMSKALGAWTIEVAPSATFFSDNTDFNIGHAFAQSPVYAVQGHVMYSFPSGVWLSFDGIYLYGGRSSLDGVTAANLQTNARLGLTLALPIDRHQSVKLYVSTGAATRTGSEFSLFGVAWQYRWGEGY